MTESFWASDRQVWSGPVAGGDKDIWANTHDVDGGDLELALLVELVQVVDTGGGLLGDTLDLGEELRELCEKERGAR